MYARYVAVRESHRLSGECDDKVSFGGRKGIQGLGSATDRPAREIEGLGVGDSDMLGYALIVRWLYVHLGAEWVLLG